MWVEANEKILDVLSVEGKSDTYLLQVLKYPLWNYTEAIQYLLGIYKLNPYDSNENTIINLAGEELNEAENLDLFIYLKSQTERLNEIWGHTGYADKHSPFFFIKWAQENDFDILWLDYVENNIDLKSKSSDLYKDLSDYERKTLLVIIAALLKEAKIDLNKPKAAFNIACLTESLGVPVSKSTIQSKLNLIPEALESRKK